MDNLNEIVRKAAYGAAFGLAVIVALSLAGCESRPTPKACTEEAKLCPDGVTYVGRNPNNNCEFDPCPAYEPTESVFCTMEVLACPDGTYVGRKAPYCLFEACSAPQDKCNLPIEGEGAYMPNPASKYCVDIGGEIIIRDAPEGGQYGVCLWEGIEMDEWELYRKNCQD